MKIKCDNCGVVFDKDDAVLHEPEDGETLYFCSEECLDTADLTDLADDEDEEGEPDDDEGDADD